MDNTQLELGTAPVVPFGVELMRTLSASEIEYARLATASGSPTSNGGMVLDNDD